MDHPRRSVPGAKGLDSGARTSDRRRSLAWGAVVALVALLVITSAAAAADPTGTETFKNSHDEKE